MSSYRICCCVGKITAAAAKKESKDKLNIILTLVDDLDWKDLGCYGSRFYGTPNIDRLS